MSIESRFHVLVVMLTVSIMFILITSVTQFISQQNLSGIIYGLILSVLSSVGVYMILMRIILLLLRKIPFIKRLILGPYYIEGTWVGYWSSRNPEVETRYILEFYEQDLGDPEVSGGSYNTNFEKYSEWTSTSSKINIKTREMYYSYVANVMNKPITQKGTCKFQLFRNSSFSPPFFMRGFIEDTTGERLGGAEWKISSSFINEDEALKKAESLTKLHRNKII